MKNSPFRARDSNRRPQPGVTTAPVRLTTTAKFENLNRGINDWVIKLIYYYYYLRSAAIIHAYTFLFSIHFSSLFIFLPAGGPIPYHGMLTISWVHCYRALQNWRKKSWKTVWILINDRPLCSNIDIIVMTFENYGKNYYLTLYCEYRYVFQMSGQN